MPGVGTRVDLDQPFRRFITLRSYIAGNVDRMADNARGEIALLMRRAGFGATGARSTARSPRLRRHGRLDLASMRSWR